MTRVGVGSPTYACHCVAAARAVSCRAASLLACSAAAARQSRRRLLFSFALGVCTSRPRVQGAVRLRCAALRWTDVAREALLAAGCSVGASAGLRGFAPAADKGWINFSSSWHSPWRGAPGRVRTALADDNSAQSASKPSPASPASPPARRQSLRCESLCGQPTPPPSAALFLGARLLRPSPVAHRANGQTASRRREGGREPSSAGQQTDRQADRQQGRGGAWGSNKSHSAHSKQARQPPSWRDLGQGAERPGTQSPPPPPAPPPLSSSKYGPICSKQACHEREGGKREGNPALPRCESQQQHTLSTLAHTHT